MKTYTTDEMIIVLSKIDFDITFLLEELSQERQLNWKKPENRGNMIPSGKSINRLCICMS